MARTNPTAWIRVPNGGTPEQPSVYTAIREALQEGADAARDLQAQLDKLKGTGSGNGSALSPTTQYILSGGGVAPTAATVESVGLAAPTEFTVTNSPVTTTGTLTLAWANATQNYVFAAPSSSTGTPSFRALVSGDLPTVPVSKGGTNLTSLGTANQVLGVNNGTTALEYKTVTAGSGISISHAAGSITITNTSPSSGGTVTSVTGTSPVSVATGTTTPVISLSAAYGDTLNPYGSKTANYVLAAPDGMAGVPSFRALVANDIPNISAAKITSGTLALARGGTGADLSATGGTGQYVKQATMGGAFSVGTIPASDIASGQALTASNDTNVTLTLGGTPSTALLKAASITAGWSGQLSVARGGTALSSLGTANQVLGVNNGVTALEYKTVTAGTGISVTHGTGTITVANTGVTSVGATSPVASSGGATPTISLSTAYGDTLNPYGVKTANYVLAGPTTGAAAVPSFRALVAADIPSLSGTYLPLAGGTMSGAINMGTNDINNAGQVGIGTATPSKMLHLSSTGSAEILIEADTDNVTETDNARILFKQDGGGTNARVGFRDDNTFEIAQVEANDIVFRTTDTERVRITSGGNVGIGINNPGAKLEFVDTNAAFNTTTPGTTRYATHFRSGATNDYATGITWAGNNGTQTAAHAGIYVQSSGGYGTKMYFATTNSYATGAQTAMTIDHNRRVGIGTTSPGTLLHLGAGTATVAPFRLTSGTNLTTAAAGSMEFDGTNLYFTPSTTRKTVAFTDSNITGTAANVTGTVVTGNGGTGLTSIGSSNQVLGVDNGATALEYKTVTAGTGISISHAAGSITITNTSPSSGGTVTSVTASSPLASSGGTTPNISLTGTVAIANGGTGQTTATAAFDALSPLTTLGDLIYHNGTDNVRLAGNTTTTKQFLRQTGNGTISAAPAWDTVTKTDVGLGNVENTALSTWAGSANLVTLGTVTTGTWSATTIAVGKGGTGLTSTPTNGQLLIGNGTGYTLATLTAGSNITITNGMGSISIAAATGMSNPMTTLGDIIYGGASGTPTRLPGETTTTRKFLLSVGSAGAALAPAWATLTSADIPSLSATYLPLAGGTMSGDINLGNNELVNVNNITIGSAAVDTAYAVDVNDTSASGIISRFKNADTSSLSYITVESDTAATRLYAYGSTASGTAPFTASTCILQGAGSGGLYLVANDAAGVISFITAGLTTANERMKIAANGNITMDMTTLFVDAVNNEVGVGTITPAQKLDVAGTLIVTGNSDMPVSAGTNVRITGGYASPDIGRIFVGDGTGWKLHFSSRSASTNTDRVTIQDNGNFIVDTNTLYVDAVNNRVGIGTTPSFPFHFQVSSTETTSFAYKLRANWDLTPSGASAATQYMSYLTATTTGANFTGNLFGSYNNVAHNGASNVSTYGAVGGFVALQSTGNMGNAYAFYAGAPSRVSTGTITNAVGLYIVAQAVTGVTNPYGIYQAGTSDENVFAGKVSIGAATDPTNALDVTGVATVSGNFTVDTNTFHVDATNNRIGVGTTTPSVLAHFFQSTTGDAQVRLNNNNAGTAAVMTYLLTNGSANAGLELTGASFTTYPSRLKLYNGAAGGVVMESDNAAGFFSVSTAATFPTGERMRIKGDVKALSGLTSVISLGLNAGSYAGATIIYTVEATDGTNHQCASGIVSVAIARNTAGAYATGQVSDTKTASSVTSGTLTVTWSAPTGANPSLVQVTATSSLAGATARIRYTVFRNGEGTLNIL